MKRKPIPIYPTEEQHKEITEAAKRNGLSFSSYCLTHTIKQAKKDNKK